MTVTSPELDRASAPLHVVFGAGQVGLGVAERLHARGLRVRVVKRGATPPELCAEIAWVRADASDADAAARAAQRAAVVYDCTNPARYSAEAWRHTLPGLRRGVRAAAARNGALLVVLDNLYMLGMPADGVLTEASPLRPLSDKGRLRAELAEELADAEARGEVRATVGRAADFFGPGAAASALYGEATVRSIARGTGAFVLGDPDLPRSYSYVPDVAEGLVTLGLTPDRSEGHTFHLPCAWKRGTTRALVTAIARACGSTPRLVPAPRWALRLLGLFVPDVGGIAEMVYQWEAPYVLDDTRFERTFGVRATPAEAAIQRTVRALGIASPEVAALAR